MTQNKQEMKDKITLCLRYFLQCSFILFLSGVYGIFMMLLASWAFGGYY